MSQIISIRIYSQHPFISFTAMGPYWLIPVNGTIGNTSSIEEAEYELIELETENRVSLFISWCLIVSCSYAVSLFIRQV